MFQPYSGFVPDDQLSFRILDEADIAGALADFSARRRSPILSAYLTGAACPPATPRERNAALAAMRDAWTLALIDAGADQLHVTAYTTRELNAWLKQQKMAAS